MTIEQLRNIPLGDLGEGGKNLLVVKSGPDSIVFDALKLARAYLFDVLTSQRNDPSPEQPLSRQIRTLAQEFVFQRARLRPVVLSTVLEI